MTGWLRRREHERAVERWRQEERAWQAEQDEMQGLLATAQTFRGASPADDPGIALQTRPGEAVLYSLDGVALIEPRRQPGHWQGGYSGFSFRVAKGVRYHVGGTRGHYVPGAEVPSPIDRGSVTITDQRVVFQGSKQAREWAFAKLLGYQHDPQVPWTAIQVSNRQKVSGVLYDAEHATELHFRLALALARYRGEVPAFVAHLQAELDEHTRSRPLPPPPLPG